MDESYPPDEWTSRAKRRDLVYFSLALLLWLPAGWVLWCLLPR